MQKSPTRYGTAVGEALTSRLDQHKAASFHVSTSSMTPVLRPGDVITVRKAPVDKLAVGDLVVVISGGTMIVHRLLRKRRSENGLLLVTKGDRHSHKDPPWDLDQYVARAEAVHGNRRRINLLSLRLRIANRLYGALANVECAIFAWFDRDRIAEGAAAEARRWPRRALRAPGRLLLALALIGRPKSVTTAEQRREFLYACLRGDDPAVEAFCGALAMDDGAWAEVVGEAERCQLLPLLHSCLRRHPNRVPGWTIEKIAQAHLRSYAHNLNLNENLTELLGAFKEADLPLVLLKGSAQLNNAKALESGRPTSDLDLLVRDQDQPRAVAVLEDMGYQSLVHHDTIAALEGKATTLMSRQRRTIVDLHTQLFRPIPFTVDMDALWGETIPVTVGDEPTLTLRPERTLLYMALHYSWFHGYSLGMKWLYDIALVVESCNGQFDWQGFLRCAREWRAGKAAYWPLKLARDLLEVPVPAEVLEEIRPRKVPRWVTRWLLKRLDALPGGRRPPDGDDRVAQTLYWLVTSGPGVSFRQRLRMSGQRLFPETLLAVHGHEPSLASVLVAMTRYARPSKLRRAARVLFKSIT